MDPDDKVRLAAIRVFSALESPALLNVPKDVLVHVGHRCKDKKVQVRLEATKALGKIFKMMYPEM
jgi:vesicle coat complex subunit